MNRFFTLLFAASCLTAVGQVPDYVPTEGMVGWWPFEGNYSNDYSGVTPVEVSEVAFSDGHFGVGQAAFFNDSAYIDLGDMPSPEEFTLTAWVRPSAGALDTWGNVYSDFVSDLGGLALLHSSSQQITGLYSHTTLGLTGTCTTELELEEESWQFVAMTRNTEGEVKIYWNMQLVGNCQSTTSPAQHSESAFIGRAAHSDTEHWLGEIDDFGFWSRALNEVEMQSLYDYQPQMGCTDSDACNYDDNAEFDDGSCVSCEVLATACLEGTIWSAELGGCIVANPADINLDGCVQLNDLLDLLSAYGDCGAEESPWQCGDPLEYQGYDYETVQIGEQCWFAENLRAENYRNGDPIPSGLDNATWQGTTDGAVSVSGENVASLSDYGHLYNWYAVDDYRSLCPIAWHVSDNIDWMALEVHLGMTEEEAMLTGWRGSDQGFQLKSDFGWTESGNGSNASQFGALPAGGRNGSGFYGSGFFGAWWSNSTNGSFAWLRSLDDDKSRVNASDNVDLYKGFSIRCIKDTE